MAPVMDGFTGGVGGRGGARRDAETERAELRHRCVGGVAAASGRVATSGRVRGSRATSSSAASLVAAPEAGAAFRGAGCGAGEV